MMKMKPEHKKEYESLFKSVQYGELIYGMSILSDMIEMLEHNYIISDSNIKDLTEHIKDVKELVAIYAMKRDANEKGKAKGKENRHSQKNPGTTPIRKD
jgi:hypothetical protein